MGFEQVFCGCFVNMKDDSPHVLPTSCFVCDGNVLVALMLELNDRKS